MLKKIIILFALVVLLFSCSKKDNKRVIEDEPTEEEIVLAVPQEGVPNHFLLPHRLVSSEPSLKIHEHRLRVR